MKMAWRKLWNKKKQLLDETTIYKETILRLRLDNDDHITRENEKCVQYSGTLLAAIEDLKVCKNF